VGPKGNEFHEIGAVGRWQLENGNPTSG